MRKILIYHGYINRAYTVQFIWEYLKNLNLNLNFFKLNKSCRYGNSEVHSISAFLGGCAAHESIKLLTNQFVPFNNTMVYNGIKQSTTIYEL